MNTLPPKARQKLAILQEKKESAQALVTSTLSRVGEADRALGNNPEGQHSGDWEFELSRLRANLGKHQQRFEQLSSLVANIRRWLNEQRPSVVLSDAKPIKIRERSGASIFDAIDRTRSEISVLASQLRDVRDAGISREELYAQAAKYVQTQAVRAEPRITASFKEFRIEFGVQSSFTNPGPDLPAFLCWLDPDAVLGLLTKKIDTLPVPKIVLTPAERDTRTAELKQSLLRLERTEEQLIVQAEQEHDQFVPRRPTADPAAVLGVVAEREVKVAAA